MTAESLQTADAHSRYCGRCQEHKSIRGVWYLVQEAQDPEAIFYCETCFTLPRESRPTRREPPAVDPARVPEGPGPATARGQLDPPRRW